KSDSACPKSSAIGKGHVTANAGDGGIKSEIDVTPYVTKSGDLGLWLATNAPLPIHQMLIGKVTNSRIVKVAIPSNIQQPLVGVKSAITVMNFSLKRGVVSTGCGAGKKWALKFQNVYDDGGSATATPKAPCDMWDWRGRTGSGDRLVGQLVPALSPADLRAQVEGSRFRRVRRRPAELLRGGGDVPPGLRIQRRHELRQPLEVVGGGGVEAPVAREDLDDAAT